MSYLKMALEALQATTSEGEAGAQRCGFTSPAPNHTPATEANQGPNPLQGWGKCLKRNKGRYGCATACEAALATGPKDASNAHLEN